MQTKSILVVDQDEMILSILKKSLLGFEPNAAVTTINSTEALMACLPQNHFETLIIDYGMLTRDDYKVFAAIKSSQEPAPMLVVTAYPNSDLSLHKEGLVISQTLFKPVELGNLNNLLLKIFVKSDALPQTNLTFTEQLYEESQAMMDALLRETNARCIVLSDTDGRILLQSGATQDMAIDEVAALMGGGMSTLLEVGKSLQDEDVINLTYREGNISDLYAINIGVRLILLLVIDRGPFYTRLGTVWFYARQTAINLMEKMDQAAAVAPAHVFDESTTEAYNQELDRLFKDLSL